MVRRTDDIRNGLSVATQDNYPPGFGVRPARRSRFPHPTIMLGYAVALLMGVTGVLILTGFLFHAGVPEKFRIMFGIVIALMGAYRFVLTRSRSIQRSRDEGDAT